MAELFDNDELSGISQSRRAFLKKLALGAAFAVPVVTSFGMGKSDAAVGPGVPLGRFGGGNLGGFFGRGFGGGNLGGGNLH